MTKIDITFLIYTQVCLLPEHKDILKTQILGSRKYLVNTDLCKDSDSLRSTKFVVLFENTNLVYHLVEAMRFVNDLVQHTNN